MATQKSTETILKKVKEKEKKGSYFSLKAQN